jgi:hypothetical protein
MLRPGGVLRILRPTTTPIVANGLSADERWTVGGPADAQGAQVGVTVPRQIAPGPAVDFSGLRWTPRTPASVPQLARSRPGPLWISVVCVGPRELPRPYHSLWVPVGRRVKKLSQINADDP